MDINKINKNMKVIKKYLENLDNFKIYSKEDLEKNFNDYLAISMSLFTILNSIIEIGEELIDHFDLDFPETYRKIFEILGNNGIISKDLSRFLSFSMKHRNMIAHQYENIDIGEIFELYSNRKIFNEFLNEVKKLI
jgi:uncharacterized protein YutE (UPF0331/DUF86 family)